LLHTELNGTKILVLSERLSGLWLLSLNWLRFRIMREKVPGVVLQNFATAARLFFSGIRTPASFVAGSSLAALLTTTKIYQNRRSAWDHFLIRLYHALMLSSFTLGFLVVVVSTGASTSLLHGEFNAMATSAYSMLRREFEYEFLVTRWSLMMALLCFVSGAIIRIVLEFDLGKKNRRNHAFAFVFILISLLTNMLSYMNTTLYCWDNLFSMTTYLFQFIINQVIEEHRPLQIISIISAVIGYFFMIQVVVSGKLSDEDDKGGSENALQKTKKE